MMLLESCCSTFLDSREVGHLLAIVDGNLVRGWGDVGVLGGAASFLRLSIRPNPRVLVHHTYHKQRSQLWQVIRLEFCNKNYQPQVELNSDR